MNSEKTGIRERGSGISRLQRELPLALGFLALGMWIASCDNGGHGKNVFAQSAQTAQTTTPAAFVTGTFYSPETDLEKLDVQALDATRATVDFAAFSLTDQAIADKLKALAGRGGCQRRG